MSNKYKWNLLNNAYDLVFVVDIHTQDIVLKNNVFDELVREVEGVQGLDVKNLFPTSGGNTATVEEAMSVLAQDPSGQYVKALKQIILDREVDIEVTMGFFDEDFTEIYFVFKGYNSILEFVRFRNSIMNIPESIAVLKFDQDLSIYCVNKAFEETFGAQDKTFIDAFEGSLAKAFSEEEKEENLFKITEALIAKKKSLSVVELYSSQGRKHYVQLHFTLMDDVLNYSFLCLTAHVVDENVEQYLKIQNENEAYNIAHRFSNSIIFKVDIRETKIEFFGDSIANFYLEGVGSDFYHGILNRELVYEEDVAIFKELVTNINSGIEKSLKLRLNAKDGRHDWYQAEYLIYKNEAGIPVSAFGKLTNVQMNQELLEKANLDLLTACLNKGTFELLTKTLLSEKEEAQHAFIIMDIDNFKAVNDNLGHFFGDIVLKEIASKLKRIFRTTDYIARIGGDEFVVLMHDICDIDTIENKAKEIVKAFDVTYKGESANYRITASVGIALYPTQADDYEVLYQKADIALYHAKNLGKNNYAFYDDSFIEGTMRNTTPIDVANRALSAYFDQEVALDTFNLLFDSVGNHSSVDTVMRHLGEHYGVDRCYVFERKDYDSEFYDNTYEWCGKNIEPQKDMLQDVHISAFAETFAEANADGVYYCNDVSQIKADSTREILQMQGIQSLILSFVKRDDGVEYVLGFDDCKSKRLWKPVEISTLTYASKIIAQYLLYKKAILYMEKDSLETLNVLNTLNFFAYIIDVENYQIMYYNECTKNIVPSLELGDVCFKVLRGNDKPCDDCPLKTLKEKNANKTRSLIHNDMLQFDILVTASYLDSFNGKKGVFVSSTNITDIVEKTNISIENREIYTTFE